MDNNLVSEDNYLGAIDMGAFDLDEALASAGESCRRYAESKSFVSKLPAVQQMDADAVCSVCMEGFDHRSCLDSDGNKRLPCGHVHHATCITAWISRCNSCPLCRSQILLQCN